MAWQLWYQPQVGQTTCGSFACLHRLQVEYAGSDAFHCERRERVLLRDIRRFGTATAQSSRSFT